MENEKLFVLDKIK